MKPTAASFGRLVYPILLALLLPFTSFSLDNAKPESTPNNPFYSGNTLSKNLTDYCEEVSYNCGTIKVLSVTTSGGLRTFRIKIQTSGSSGACGLSISYVAFQLPNGVSASSPNNNSTYQGNLGNYNVVNPTGTSGMPGYNSIKFESGNFSFKSGAWDIFEFVVDASVQIVTMDVTMKHGTTTYTKTLDLSDCIDNVCDTTNPTTSLAGFLVLVQGNSTLTSNESDGPVAIGGNLTVNGNYQVANQTGGTFYDAGNSKPVGLLVNGRVIFSGGNSVTVNGNSYAKIGDCTGANVYENGGNTRITPGGFNATPLINVNTGQPSNTVCRPGLFDFVSAFSGLNALATGIAACENNVIMKNANGVPLPNQNSPGSQAYITLQSNKTNILNLSGSALSQIQTLTFTNLPTATRPLVINVNASGNFSWNVFNMAGIGDNEGKFIIWTFNNTTTLTLTGGGTMKGTLFVPGANLVKNSTGNIDGAVVAKSFVQTGGEIHYYPFSAQISVCDCDVDPCESLVLNCAPDITVDCGTSFDPTVTGWATGGPNLTYVDNVALNGCNNTGNIERVWTVTNSCDETQVCYQNITVVDNDAPVFEGGNSNNCWPNGITSTTFNTAEAVMNEFDEFFFVTDGRIGNNTNSGESELGIHNFSPYTAYANQQFSWPKAVDVPFSLVYNPNAANPADRFIYTVTNGATQRILKYNPASHYDWPLEFDGIWLYGVIKKSSTLLINNLTINGTPLNQVYGQVNNSTSTKYINEILTGADFQNGFTITGMVKMDWSGTMPTGAELVFKFKLGKLECAPSLNCAEDLIVTSGQGNMSQTIQNWLNSVTADDECGGVTVTNNYNGSTVCGDYTVVFTATDACGNSSTCSALLTIIDNVPPVFTPVTETLTLNCTSPIPPFVPFAATDNSGNVNVVCDETTVHSAEGLQICAVSNMSAPGENHPRIAYFEQMPGAANNYFKVESAQFIRYGDGTAKISGVMSHTTNDQLAWEFEVHFRNARNWTQWSALGRTYMVNGGVNAHLSLIYYEMDPTQSNTFTGIRAYQGSNLTVSHTPADFMKGFQLGNWGNVFTSNFGFGGWMKYSGQIHYNGQTLNRSNVQADFNLNLGCQPPIEECVDIITRICVATDPCGNSATQTQTILITDETAPTFTYVPANYTANCQDVLVYDIADATDACSEVTVTELPRDTIDGNCVYNYVINRTFKAVDECGNESFAYQTITVVDNTPPVFTYVPADYTASCEDNLTYANATASDNCGAANVTVSVNTIPGNCVNEYLKVRTFTATDICGNTATASQTITVVDDSPPVNTNPPVNLTINCGDVIPSYTPIFTDNCAGTINVQTILPGVVGHCGVQAIETYIATDVCGNQTTVTRTLTFEDNINPTFTSVPANFTASCDDVLTFAPAFATDNCGNATVNESRDTIDGNCANEFIIVRTFTATDVCGNTATASRTITIEDNEAPVFAPINENLTLNCTDDLPVFTPFVATDNCGNPDVVCEETSVQSTQGLQICEVANMTYSGENAPRIGWFQEMPGAPSNYFAMESAQFIQYGDGSAKLTGVMSHVTNDQLAWEFELNFRDARTWAQWSALGRTYKMEAVSGNDYQTWTYYEMDPAETNTLTGIRAYDGSNITLAHMPANYYMGFQVGYKANSFTNTFGMSGWMFYSGQIHYNGQTYNRSNKQGDFNMNLGCGGQIEECVELLTRTCVATDACGNSATQSQTLIIVDDQAPVFDYVPANYNANCEDNLVFENASATDACSNVTVTEISRDTVPGICEYTFTINRTFKAVDECDNESFAYQTISVSDTEAPVISGVPPTVTLTCVDEIPDGMPMVTDNCSEVDLDMFQEIVPGECEGNYTIIRTYTATDACGNSSTALQTITVINSEAPVIEVCAPNITITDCNGSLPAPDDSDIEVSSVSCDPTQNTCTYTVGCVTYEVISNTVNGAVRTVSIRVTSNCFHDISYVAFQLPGVPALSPANNSTYHGTLGNYHVENTTNNPFYSIKFESIGDPFNNGESETFTYTLPAGAVYQTLLIEAKAATNKYRTEVSLIPCDTEPEYTITWEGDEDNGATGCIGDERVVTRTWRVTNSCGQFVECEQLIQFTPDTQAPVFTNVPQSYNASCDQTLVYEMPTATDHCGVPTVIELPRDTDVDGCVTTIIRTFRATDECGNTATVSQTIVVTDDEAPVFASIQESLTITCSVAIPEFVPFSATDNCGNPAVVCEETTIEALEGVQFCDVINMAAGGENFPRIAYFEQMPGAANNYFKVESAEFIRFGDGTAKITGVMSHTTNGDLAWEFEVHFRNARNWAQWSALGRTYMTSGGGNAYQNLTYYEMDPTQSNTFTGIRAYAGSNLTVAHTPADFMKGFQLGNWGNVFTSDFGFGGWMKYSGQIHYNGQTLNRNNVQADFNLNLGCAEQIPQCADVLVRTCVATDECGNSSSKTQTIVITDDVAPVFTYVPANYTADCEDVLVYEAASASDACSNATVTELPRDTIDGNCVNRYVITRTFRAVDECGNESFAYQTITVVDNTAPTFTHVPADYTASCEEILTYTDAIATDNCGIANVTESRDTVDGNCANRYLIIRTFTATDLCGNTATATQTITVVDNTPPVNTNPPADVIVNCGDIIPAYVPTFTDNCDGPIDVQTILPSVIGHCGVEAIETYIATDVCGNQTTVTRTLIFVDEINPTFTSVPANFTASCEEVLTYAPAFATDNCGNALVSETRDTTDGVCANEYIIVRTFTATDECGNTASTSQSITITDEVAPTFTFVPANYTAVCSDVLVLTPATATDNCGIATVSEVRDTIPGNCPNESSIVRIFTATDLCGNTATASQTITITDEVAPTFTYVPANYSATCNTTLTFENATATDNCGTADVTEVRDTVPGNCPNEMSIVRTFTATDLCGNTRTATQTINVIDEVDPTFTFVPANYSAVCYTTLTFDAATATDNCGTASVTVARDTVPGTCINEFTIVRTFTATDLCGNTATATQTITVTDEVAPTFTFVPANYSASCEEELVYDNATAIDNCGTANVTESRDTVPGTCANEYVIVRTFTATDLCGNTAAATQSISINDIIAPVFVNVPADLVFDCADDIPAFVPFTATDNCGNPTVVCEETQMEALEGFQECEVLDMDYSPEPAPRMGWFQNMPGTPDAYFSVEQANFMQFGDGTAHLTGVMTHHSNPDLAWEIDIWFRNARTWTEWSALGRSYKYEQISGDYYLDMLYFEMDDTKNNTLTGIRDYAGSALTVVHMPADYTYGFQYGEGGNAFTTAFGFGGWMKYSGNIVYNGQSHPRFSVAADFNFEMNCGDDLRGQCADLLIRTCVATDACGNQSTAQQIITLVDETAPAFTYVPANYTTDCDVAVVFDAATAEDNCSFAEITETRDTIPGTCAYNYDIVRTFTVVDECGNENTATQTISVRDVDAPVFQNVPANYTASCEDVLTYTTPTAIDNCGTAVVVESPRDTIPGNCINEYTIIRTFVATDDCGNSTSVSQTINVVDDTNPTFTFVPSNYTAVCNTVLTFAPATATDNCGNATITEVRDTTPGRCANEFSILRTFTATDLCGNTSTATQTIFVIDEVAPTFTFVPANYTASCEEVLTYASATATDNCGTANVTEVRDTTYGQCINEFSILRTFTATDLCGNTATATQTIIVTDEVNPTFTFVPANYTASCETVLTFALATATDNCGIATVTEVRDTTPGSCINRFSILRTFTATDLCGNTATATQTITVTDEIKPTFTFVPASYSAVCNTELTFAPATATDNCGTATVTEIRDTLPGLCANEFYVVRRFTATDLCGNTKTASQTINVRDQIAPTFTFVPASYSQVCNTDLTFESATATDNCGTASVTEVRDTLPGVCANEFSIRRTFTATDLCGNTGTATQTISVTDEVPPTFTFVPAGYTIACDDPIVYQNATATDNCGTATVTEVRDTVLGNCLYNFDIIRTFTATDLCGNTSTATQTIVVRDTLAPLFTFIPGGFTATCSDILTLVPATATDNCGIPVVTEVSDTIPGLCANEYTIIRTFTATDLCGNTRTATQTINIIDEVAPTFTFVPANYTASCETILVLTPATATDNCGIAIVTEVRDTTDGSCANEFSILRTFTATDLCGNTATATQTITVTDEVAPIFTFVPASYSQVCNTELTFASATATDNCGIAIVTEVRDTTDGVCANEFSILRTFTATDLCGNTSTATQTISVTDEVAPAFTFVPASYSAVCNTELTFAVATATDNCGIAIVTEVRDTTDGVCANEFSILRTFTATDLCGNTATATQTITVTDEVAPNFTFVPAGYSAVCSDELTFAVATATDNCGIAIVTEVRDTTDGVCANEFSILRTFTATDLCGNTATATQTITVTDEVNPSFTFVPANYTASCETTLTFAAATATDNCGIAIVTEVRDTTDGVCANEFSILRTFTATDLCGNTATATQTITVTDEVAPTFTFVPASYSQVCNTELTFAAATATDNCGIAIVTEVRDTTDGVCANEFSILRTFTATDLCGNSATATQTITVTDEVAPTFTFVPASYSQICNTELTFASATATDNCGIAIVTEVRDTTPGTCANEFSILRTFTATDLCGNTATATQTISVTDEVPPTFTFVPAGYTIACDDPIIYQVATATDNCGTAAVIEVRDTVLGNCLYNFDIIRTFTATDLCGNTSTATQTISVRDTLAPLFTFIPGGYTASCSDQLVFAPATAVDNCGIPVITESRDTVPGSCVNEFTIIRTFTATDLCGNTRTATQTINVTDEVTPTFTFVPASYSAVCASELTFAVATATDNCGMPVVTEVRDTTPGTCANEFSILRTFTATDLCGNTATATQTITVTDEVAPTFTFVPASYSQVCNTELTFAAATATDNCGIAIVTEVRDTTDGVCANEFSILRTFTATDLCGNTATATQTITVTDEVAPTFTFVPASYSVVCNTELTFAAATATDNCGTASVTEVRDTTDGVCANEFSILRTFTATDLCGNTATATQTITVTDEVAPTFTFVPASYSAVCNTELTYAAATATDNCGTATVTEVRDTIDGNCANEFSILRTFTATDLCGNTATATQTITVTDEVAPTFTFVPASYSAVCNNNLTFALATATDNCGMAIVTEVRDTTDGSCANEFSILRTFTATDLCGNTATATQTITVTDEVAPTFTFVPVSYSAVCNTQLTLAAATATDNCGIAIVTEVRDTTDGTCANEFSILRTFTATDLCGNTATATQTITVTDEVAPTFTFVPASYSQVCNAELTFANATATDNCGIANVTEVRDTTDGVCANEFSILRTFTATDLCGNTATATQTVTVTDEVAPTFTFVPASYTAVCNTELTFASATATDNCGTASVTEVRDTIDGNCANEFSILRTFTATDLCGNTATATQTISVTDEVAPTFTSVPANYSASCEEQLVYAPATATDNCGTASVTEARDTVPGSCANEFTIVRTFTATDLCGNTATATQSIAVHDSIAPIFIDVPADLVFNCNDVLPEFVPFTATDNCGDPTVVCTESELEELPGDPICEVLNMNFTSDPEFGEPAPRIGWFQNMPGTPDAYFSVEQAQFERFEDGTAHLTGIMTHHSNPDLAWEINVWFRNARTWAQWSALGRSYKYEHISGDFYQDMLYYEMDDTKSNTLTGIRAYAGSSLSLVHMPADYTYGFQYGYGGNAFTTSFGFGGWMKYTGNIVYQGQSNPRFSVASDFNFDLECLNEFPEPCTELIQRTCVATDACGNETTASQLITIIDTEGPEFTFVPANVTAECDEEVIYQSAIAVDNCTNVTITEVRDTVPGLCVYNFDIIRTFTATDECGNSSTASHTIFVRDTEAPNFNFVPANYTASCEDELTYEPATATDNCGIPTVVEAPRDTIPGACVNEYSIIRRFIATDECGNSRTATQTINVIDETLPVFTFVPANYSAVCNTELTFAPATASDNCGNASVTESRDTLPGACVNEFSIIRTFTATDLCGNTATTVQTITVTDNVAPTFVTVPANFSAACDDDITFTSATATDNCGTASVTEARDTVPGTCENEFTIVRTFTATDLCGNTATVTRTITITDDENPTFTFVPASFSAVCNNDLILETALATDNCGIATVTETRDTLPGTCENEFSILRTFTATDLCGNTATSTQTINVTDEVPPTFTFVPANYSAVCNTELTFAPATANDNCGTANVTEVRDTTEGSCANEFSILRTFTATDLCGNTATATQLITVTDEVAPIFTFVPSSYNAGCNEELTFDSAIATDNCGTATVTEARDTIPGICENSFSILRTFTATDLCGNTATATQTIVVGDNTLPIFTYVPQGYTIACDDEVVFENATATDACGEVIVTEVRDTVPGTCINNYDIIRTFIASDACENTVSVVQIIQVRDTLAPLFTFIPASYTASCSDVLVFAPATSVDNCGSSAVTEVRDTTDGSCANEFSILRTFTATDLCGNTRTATQVINVVDETAPIFAFIPASYNATCAEELTFANAEATDNCGTATVTEVRDTTEGACAGEFSILRTFTATDLCGNTATATQTINVSDESAPVFTFVPANYSADCTETLTFDNATATDNCGNAAVTVAQTTIPGACVNEFSILRTFTATDLCGNTATATQTITVTDDVNPTFTFVPASYTVGCNEEVILENATATDNCGTASVTVSVDSIAGNCASNYTLIRTFTATDVCGNTATATQTITAGDNTMPAFTFIPQGYTISCEDPVVYQAATATDVCGNVTVSEVRDTLPGTCINNYNIRRTFTASDACGNDVSVIQIIQVRDTLAPLFNFIPAAYTASCSDQLVFGNATAVDNCGGAVTVIEQSRDTLPGSCANNYQIVRVFRATDVCGNFRLATQTISVVDNTAPSVANCPNLDLTIECQGQEVNEQLLAEWHAANLATLASCATDNCSVVTVSSAFNPANVTLDGCDADATAIYIVTDACGNTTSVSATFTVTDATAPLIQFNDPQWEVYPTNSIVYTECNTNNLISGLPNFDENSVTPVESCDLNPEVTYTQVLEGNGDCAADGYFYRLTCTWTATDNCGNQSSRVLIIQVEDNTAPEISGVPADVVIGCTELLASPAISECGDDSIMIDLVTVEDACECAEVEFDELIIGQACDETYQILRTWTAIDNCGNATFESQLITVINNYNLEATFTNEHLLGMNNGDEIVIECTNGLLEQPDYIYGFSYSDIVVDNYCNYGRELEYSYSEYVEAVSTNCKVDGYKERKALEWSVVDQCGNYDRMTIYLVLKDVTGPEIEGLDFACSQDLSEVDAFDFCSETVDLVYQDMSIPSLCDAGASDIMRVWQATDDCGNVSVFEQRILNEDSQIEPTYEFTNPVLADIANTGNGTLQVGCLPNTNSLSGFTKNDIRFVNFCDEPLTVNFEEEVINTGDCITDGYAAQLTLTWWAVDACGRRTEFSTFVEMIDTIAPVFENVPAELFVECGDEAEAALAIDACTELQVLVSEEQVIWNGDCVFEYDVQRSLSAVDACGNEVETSQIIHYIHTKGPEINGIKLIACEDEAGTAKAISTCTGNEYPVTMTQTVAANPCAPGQVITRTYKAEDECGNITEVVQTLYRNDNQAPALKWVNNRFNNAVNGSVITLTCSQFENIDGLFLESNVIATNECAYEVDFTATQVAGINCQTSGFSQQIDYKWLVSDPCGNSSVFQIRVNYIDDVAPEFLNAPADTTLFCTSLPAKVDPTVVDYCGSDVQMTFNEVHHNTGIPGVAKVDRIWTATDACGNASTHTQTINIDQKVNFACDFANFNIPSCGTLGNVITVNAQGGTAPYRYFWNVVGGACQLQAGQGSSSIEYKMGFSFVRISVLVVDANGCTTQCELEFQCEPTNEPGVAGRPAPGISLDQVYPNPADAELYLEYTSDKTQKGSIRFLDMLGQEVRVDKVDLQEGTHTIMSVISDFKPGVYSVELRSGNQISTKVFLRY